MLAAISGARDHVHMEMYIFEDDEVGQQFADALARARKAGVTVRLIYDAVGSHQARRRNSSRACATAASRCASSTR